jgi:hypothetical protein
LQPNATIENMTDEGKLETPPPGDYRKRFWRRYGKTVFDWTVKTFWLRVFVLFAVPAILAFQQYKQGHTDWHTIWVTMAIYAVILAIYMAVQLYFTAKKLDAGMYSLIFAAYQEKAELQAEIERLSWPEDRPILVFNSWGEVPHDDPRAQFHEVTEYRKEREYWQRGVFIQNRGKGDAYEVEVFPIELTDNVKTIQSYVARIDMESKGFAFISMDHHNNVRFSDDYEIWELPKIMRQIEDKLNATRVEQRSLMIEIGARYRDANGAWYMSYCWMEYLREQDKIIFHHMNHGKFGSQKPELSPPEG